MAYDEYTLRVPVGTDTTPMKAFAQAMGWTMAVIAPSRRNVNERPRGEKKLSSLCGMFKGVVPDNMSYDEMKRQMMEEKYGQI